MELVSQSVPFPREDLPLGPCTCGPLLERYKVELEHVRAEIESRRRKQEMASGETTALQGKHEQAIGELANSHNKLQESLQESRSLEEEVCWEALIRVYTVKPVHSNKTDHFPRWSLVI